MYTKKILSAATAMAILSSGAIAFDTYTNANNENYIATDLGGVITKGNYTSATTAGMATMLSADRKGDALIYPAFNQKNGYGTEIVVRNTTDKAIVAKAVLYSGIDSEELVDFNLYLSAHDVARFQIKDGKITSSDGSIKTQSILPKFVTPQNQTVAKNDTVDVKFADTLPFNFTGFNEEKHQTGYVAIFGMVQADKDFHKKHSYLYAAYAQLLDDNRGTWRDLKNAAVLKRSLFISNVTQAPNLTIDPTADTTYHTVKDNKIVDNTVKFAQVVDTALTGEVRMFDESGHDLLLPAKAITHFSYNENANADHVVLWTEGEYASIADRCITPTKINGSANDNATTYDVACLTADSSMLTVSSAMYTYNHTSGDTYNKVLVTQPYKRTFTQLNETSAATGKYEGSTNKDKLVTNKKNVDTGFNYYFETSTKVYDEDENSIVESVSAGIILSGSVNQAEEITRYNNELQELTPKIFEQSGDAINAGLNAGNGFATFNVGVPAIITQMVASTSGDSIETNWIYSTTNK